MKELPKFIKDILKRLCESGYEAYAVGGCVRDMLMGAEPSDFDITTSATPPQTKAVFADCKVIETGIKHGTVTIIYKAAAVEITTFRCDGEYADNRHPKSVSFTSDIKTDLARRDFTSNAIAMSINGSIIDPFCGAADIKNKILRCVGNPNIRFQEDGLRILRALRFCAKLGFEMEKETAAALFNQKHLLENISAERISAEFFKLVCASHAEIVLCKFSDIIFQIIPFPIKTNMLNAFAPNESTLILRLASLFTETSTENITALLTTLKVSNEIKSGVLFIHNNFSYEKRACKPAIKRLLSKNSKKHVSMLCSFYSAHGNKSWGELLYEIESGNEPYSISQLDINGNDIKTELNISGKRVGEILNILLEFVITGELKNEKAALLKAAGLITNP